MGKKKTLLSSTSNEPSLTASAAALLQSFGVRPDAWDALVVGDGSGQTWNSAIGWCAVLVDQRLGVRKTLQGGMNFGTSYLAEILPYVHALSWYAEGPGRALLHDRKTLGGSRPYVDVHLLTDNEAVARVGAGTYAAEGRGFYYWSLLDAFVRRGYRLHWHWMKRSSTGLNKLCDHLAGKSRLAMNHVAAVEPDDGLTAYHFNPDTPKETTDHAPVAADPGGAVEPA